LMVFLRVYKRGERGRRFKRSPDPKISYWRAYRVGRKEGELKEGLDVINFLIDYFLLLRRWIIGPIFSLKDRRGKFWMEG